LYNKLKNPYIYTIETSQFGTEYGHWSRKIFNEIARSVGKSMIVLFKIKNEREVDYKIYE
jgi:hypothetical protein